MRILVRIFFKDYVVTAYLSDRLFLATGHILLKISSKISSRRLPKMIPSNSQPSVPSVSSVDKFPMIRALRVFRGLSERPPWINFFVTF